MPAPFAVLGFPETQGSLSRRRKEILPFVHAAYVAGQSPYELFHALGGTTVNLPSSDFYSVVNREYSKLARATSIQSLAGADVFKIGDLPQQKARLPDRFYAIYTTSYRTTEGIETTKTRIYGFGDKMSKDDIEDDIAEQLSEHYGVKENQIASIDIQEIYKQY